MRSKPRKAGLGLRLRVSRSGDLGPCSQRCHAEPVAKLTEEQKAKRAATRRHNDALEAEHEHERRQARDREWAAKGARLTREQLEAGDPCRGCGLPIIDGLGDWPWPQERTPEQQAAHDAAEVEYRTRHADCHSHRWSLSGSRSVHCGWCCPPHPPSQNQIDHLAAILTGHKPDPSELDSWRLTLTCGHTVDRPLHRSNQRWTAAVVPCSTCASHRGVVESERLVAAV